MFMGTIILLVVMLGLTGVAAHLIFLYNKTGAFFDSNGVRLHYVEAGQGTPVILVHGFGMNLATNWMFPRMFQKLSRRYRVIALDNRGHGKSGKPHDPALYGLEMVEDIVRLMDHLGIEKAHVVGASMGGFITLKLALTHPERLLSAAPCLAGWAANPEEELKVIYGLSDDLEQGRGVTRLLKWLQVPEKPLPGPVVWFLNLTTCLFNDTKAFSSLMRGMPALVATEDEARSNLVPCLAIVGANDHMKVFAEQMAGVVPNLELLVIPQRDHFTAFASRKVLPALVSFMDRHTPKHL
jgi:pimeloyl-ACP methyl ester carboxylesterase